MKGDTGSSITAMTLCIRKYGNNNGILTLIKWIGSRSLTQVEDQRRHRPGTFVQIQVASAF